METHDFYKIREKHMKNIFEVFVDDDNYIKYTENVYIDFCSDLFKTYHKYIGYDKYDLYNDHCNKLDILLS